MAVVEQLLRVESDGTVSFGNHTLSRKQKVEDFEYAGDLLKVKTYNKMTKLEKNGMFVYESVPGTSVLHFKETPQETTFCVAGDEDAQITLELAEATEYEIWIKDKSIGKMKTNLGGKLNLSVELADEEEVNVKVTI